MGEPISRLNLPSEFFDRTSSQLLRQPEPQYLYAQMFKASLNAFLSDTGDFGLPGRTLKETGADYRDSRVDRLTLAGPLSEQLFAVKADFTSGIGQTLRFNRPKYTDSLYTQASRRVAVNSTISLDPINVEGEQVPLTIQRFAGPHGGSGSEPRPYAIEQHDAMHPVHRLSKIVGSHMQRDHDKFLDTVYTTLADLASTTVYPDGMTADNDATLAGQFPLTYEQISRTSKEMDEANLPVLPDGRRVLVVTPTGVKQLKDDAQFAAYVEQHKENNPLFEAAFPGFFATTPEFHCYKSNTLNKVDNASSISIHRAHAIAPEAFMGGMGIPGRIIASTDDNYEQTPKLIWLAFYAFGLANNEFIKSVRYTEDI